MNKQWIIMLSAVALAGCITNPPASSESSSTSSQRTASTEQPASKPADSKREQPSSKTADGKREVKGINDWTGYIQGTPAAKSKFAKLKIGMGQREVIDLIGAPTDQRSHVTGKAFIPFYHGSGKYETMFYYKNVGRLLFSGNGGYTTDTGLIGIEHDASERGYP